MFYRMKRFMLSNVSKACPYIYVGISAESPILGIPDEIPIYRNLIK